MPNFASLIRHEVRRLAKKETNAAVQPLRKQVASLRHRVAQQRRQIADLERAARAAAAAPAARGPAAGPGEVESEGRARFSPAWMRKHRAKLGMSRETYAKLLGASAQSVLVWESGRSRPRASTIAAWSKLRQMRVRDIKSGLAARKQPRGAARRKTTSRRKAGRRRR